MFLPPIYHSSDESLLDNLFDLLQLQLIIYNSLLWAQWLLHTCGKDTTIHRQLPGNWMFNRDQRCQPPIFSPDICAKSESNPKCRLGDNCQILAVRSDICKIGQLSDRTTVSADNCQIRQLSDRTTVRSDNCQIGQLSVGQLSVGHGQLSEETVSALKKL